MGLTTPGFRQEPGGGARADQRRPGSSPSIRQPSSDKNDRPASVAQLFVRDVTRDYVAKIARIPFTIGRREGNDLRLAGAEVSREHAEIVLDAAGYRLVDRGSSYGTFVNDQQVTEHVLAQGDRIRLGRGGGAELVFGLEATPSFPRDATSDPITDLRHLAALLEGLRALGPGHVLHEVLVHVLDSAIALSGAERGFIMLSSRDGDLRFAVGRTQGRETLDDETFPTSLKIPEAALETGEIQVVTDLQEEAHATDHMRTRSLGIRYVLCVPLHATRFTEGSGSAPAPRRIGVLYLDSQSSGRLLSETVRQFLTALAAEAALAIDNARLYREAEEKARMDRDMSYAVEIQRMLLPKITVELPFVEAAAASWPCGSVGGDFYDYFVQEGHCLSFTLGDVAGKGPSAALLSALLQGMFSIAAPGCTSPSAVVSNVNIALCERGIEARFATLFYGGIDPGGRLLYCNAGHNPPFLLGAGGVRRLEEGGPIVGVFDAATYREGLVTLSPGDRLVIFSDGVSEALSQSGEEFGDARILEILESVCAGPGSLDPTKLVNCLIDSVEAFAEGAPRSDDITAMVVRYRG